MSLIKIATMSIIILAVAVYSAHCQQRCATSILPVGYPITVFDMQACPSDDDLAGITADTNSILRNEIISALEGTLSGQEATCPATSCRAIARQQPQWPSGDYWVTNTSGAAVQVYCDLTGECCDGSPGAARVGYLNMSDPTQTCPEPWTEYQGLSLRRACGRVRANGSSAVFFPTNGVQYSRVCGRIIGYQYGRPEAFQFAQNTQRRITLETNRALNYVDGVSITYGYPGPRKHIWTFAGGQSEDPSDSSREQCCPCIDANNNNTLQIPDFVQDDYFCESGTTDRRPATDRLYDEDPLWDGEGCGPTSTDCCQFNNPPWFCKQLNETVTSEIEVRILTTASNAFFLDTEDTPIGLLELYIQ